MKRALRQTCYISIENSENIGYQLFNIAYLINILNKSKNYNIKRKIVFRKGNHIYIDSIFKGLFTVLDDDKYDKIGFEKISINDIDIESLCSSTKNIEIYDTSSDYFNPTMTFKYIDESIKRRILELVYSNEDLMYSAYYMYRDTLAFFGENTRDDDVAALHILKAEDKDYDYYYNALSIMNNLKIKNIAVITDDIEWAKTILNDINDINDTSIYTLYYVGNAEKNNYETRFILMSMFKNIIISNNPADMDSLWASYLSYYDNKKVITADKNIIHKYITDIL
jgi:Tfp pilus assembly protein PilZ